MSASYFARFVAVLRASQSRWFRYRNTGQTHDDMPVNGKAFSSALTLWLKWRGHILPVGAFTERIVLQSGSQTWGELRHLVSEGGIESTFIPCAGDFSPGAANFPVMAMTSDGHIVLVRDFDSSKNLALVFSGSSLDPVDASHLTGWFSTTVTTATLRQKMFGFSGDGRAWFWEPFRSERKAYFQAAFAAGMINLLAVLTSLYSMQVYDRVVPSDSTNTLVALTIGVCVAFGFDFVLRYLRTEIIDKAAKTLDLSLSESVFNQAVGIRMDLRPAQTGTFISQLREHETVREFFMSATVFTLSDAPFVFVFLGLTWLIGGSLVLVPLLAIPVIIGVCAIAQLPLAKLSIERVRESSIRSGLLIEAVEGAETIKTLNAEWRVGRKWRELSILLNQTALRISSINSFTGNFANAMQQFIYIGVVAFGAVAIQKGGVTAGALIACSILSQRAIAPLSQIVGLIARLHQVRASVQTLDKVMTLPTDRRPDTDYLSPAQSTGIVRLAAVEYQYPASDVVVLNVSELQFKPGERVAILGRTGSGKSTLLRLISGLYQPTSGRVYHEDIDVQHIDPVRYRSMVGYLTQDVRLFAGTLRENLLLGAGVVGDERLIEVCKVTGLNRLIAQHPRGFDLPIHEGGSGLSGGQRQAVGLARLMLSSPGIFLLDEPTASMDQTTEKEFIDRIGAHIGIDRTLILVTHKPSVLCLVDRIVVIEQGRVFMDGPRDQVLALLAAGPQAIAVQQAAQQGRIGVAA